MQIIVARKGYPNHTTFINVITYDQAIPFDSSQIEPLMIARNFSYARDDWDVFDMENTYPRERFLMWRSPKWTIYKVHSIL